jgi:hypothetical protein
MSTKQRRECKDGERTLRVEMGNHITEFLHMLGQVRMAGNIFQSLQAFPGESGRHPRELMLSPNLGQPLARQAEVADVAHAIESWHRRRPEALLGQVGSPVNSNSLVRIALDIVKDFKPEFIGECQRTAGWSHVGG